MDGWQFDFDTEVQHIARPGEVGVVYMRVLYETLGHINQRFYGVRFTSGRDELISERYVVAAIRGVES